MQFSLDFFYPTKYTIICSGTGGELMSICTFQDICFTKMGVFRPSLLLFVQVELQDEMHWVDNVGRLRVDNGPKRRF